jgi:hypothetical protein
MRGNAGVAFRRTREGLSLVTFGMHLALTRAHYVVPQTHSRGEAICHQRSTSCRFFMS